MGLGVIHTFWKVIKHIRCRISFFEIYNMTINVSIYTYMYIIRMYVPHWCLIAYCWYINIWDMYMYIMYIYMHVNKCIHEFSAETQLCYSLCSWAACGFMRHTTCVVLQLGSNNTFRACKKQSPTTHWPIAKLLDSNENRFCKGWCLHQILQMELQHKFPGMPWVARN